MNFNYKYNLLLNLSLIKLLRVIKLSRVKFHTTNIFLLFDNIKFILYYYGMIIYIYIYCIHSL